MTGTVLGIVSVVCLVGGSVKHFPRNGKIIGTPKHLFMLLLPKIFGNNVVN